MIESDLFRVLADPTRRAVFERLIAGEESVGRLKAGFEVSQPAISQHLTALKRAGLVKERRSGRNVFYRADPKGLDPLLQWVDRYRDFWSRRLARLEALLEEMEQ